MQVVTPVTTTYTSVTKLSTTPTSRRTLSFKMVEEDLSANEDADQQSDSPKALKRASPQSTPQHGGCTSLRSTTLEATAAPLSTGRRSPHIPHTSRPQSPFEYAETGKIYTQQYLPPDHQPTYLLREHAPHPAKTPNFIAPEGPGVKIRIPTRRRGMEILRDTCIAQKREYGSYTMSNASGRRSPHMNNEEPISLSTYPDAKPVPDTTQPKIEREDFPAPPYAFTDPERRKKYSQMTRKDEEEEEEEKEKEADKDVIVDPGKAALAARQEEQARKEAEQLKKISSGIANVFLHDIEERSKHRHDRWRRGIDPRNASRTASATREPMVAPRYGSPAFASPSRLDDRPRPWEEWDFNTPSPSSKWRSASSGGSTLPSYSVPRPGYAMSTAATTPKSSTLQQVHTRSSPGIPDLLYEDRTFVSGDVTRTQSGEFASTTLPDYYERSTRGDSARPTFSDTFYVRSRIAEPYYQADFLEPADKTINILKKERKIYPVQQVLVTNRKLPEDVDRNHLELHISPEDFLYMFQMPRAEFFMMPEWKRNELKKRLKLY
ncbi:hypothetical protein RvY_03898-2 [Ramazzottius varieornatus]|uniref:HP domain-containing protein n=1 Tax=Ramazzottius varieornatus TaxID=947166 RepID=A0A1D1UPN2_RAMVA|nr:hypothetical protein RvY_03898-2 [Ramazzottius varieornatus]